MCLSLRKPSWEALLRKQLVSTDTFPTKKVCFEKSLRVRTAKDHNVISVSTGRQWR